MRDGGGRGRAERGAEGDAAEGSSAPRGGLQAEGSSEGSQPRARHHPGRSGTGRGASEATAAPPDGLQGTRPRMGGPRGERLPARPAVRGRRARSEARPARRGPSDRAPRQGGVEQKERQRPLHPPGSKGRGIQAREQRGEGASRRGGIKPPSLQPALEGPSTPVTIAVPSRAPRRPLERASEQPLPRADLGRRVHRTQQRQRALEGFPGDS